MGLLTDLELTKKFLEKENKITPEMMPEMMQRFGIKKMVTSEEGGSFEEELQREEGDEEKELDCDQMYKEKVLECDQLDEEMELDCDNDNNSPNPTEKQKQSQPCHKCCSYWYVSVTVSLCFV